MTQEVSQSSPEFPKRLEKRIEAAANRIAQLAIGGRNEFPAHTAVTDMALFFRPPEERQDAEAAIRDRAFGAIATANADVKLAFYARREDLGNGLEDSRTQVVVYRRNDEQLPTPEGNEVVWRENTDQWLDRQQ